MLKLILPLVKWLQDCSFSFPKHFIYLKVQLYLSHPLQFYFGPIEEDPFLNSKLAIASWVNHFLLKWSFFSEISLTNFLLSSLISSRNFFWSTSFLLLLFPQRPSKQHHLSEKFVIFHPENIDIFVSILTWFYKLPIFA